MIAKLYFLSAFCFSLPVFVQAQPVIFSQKDYKQALTEAAGQKKDVFLLFCSDWEGSCEFVDRVLLSDSLIAITLNKGYVSLRLIAQQQEHLAAKYNITYLPTLLFANAAGSEIARYEVEPTRKQLQNTLIGISSFSVNRHKFEQNPTDFDALQKYLAVLEAKASPLTANVVERYITAIGPYKAMEPQNWKLIESYIVKTTSPVFNILLSEIDTLQLLNPRLEDYMNTRLDSLLLDAVASRSKARLNDFKKLTAELYNKLGIQEDLTAFNYEIDLFFYEAVGDVYNYFKLADKLAKDYFWEDYKGLIDMLTVVIGGKDYPSHYYTTAEKWAIRAIELKDDYFNNFAYSYLCHCCLKKPDVALEYAIKSLEKTDSETKHMVEKYIIEDLKVPIDSLSKD